MYTRGKSVFYSFVIVLLLLLLLNGCYSPRGALTQPTLTPEPVPDPSWSSERLATALYSFNPNNRWLALKYLKERGPAAAPSVPALMDILRSSPSVDTRAEAYNVLGSIGRGAKDAVPLLVEKLEEGETRDDKLGATAVLGIIGSDAKDSIPALIQVATNDEDAEVRSNAAESLGKISTNREVLDFLITRLQTESSGEVQIGISLGLCAMGAKAQPAVPYLANNLWWGQDDHGIKQAAAKAIANIVGVKFYDDVCAVGGFREPFIDGELATVVKAREWWTAIGQFQNWSQP